MAKAEDSFPVQEHLVLVGGRFPGISNGLFLRRIYLDNCTVQLLTQEKSLSWELALQFSSKLTYIFSSRWVKSRQSFQQRKVVGLTLHKCQGLGGCVWRGEDKPASRLGLGEVE